MLILAALTIAIHSLHGAEWRSGGPVEEHQLAVAFLPYTAGTSFTDGWITVKTNVDGVVIRDVVVNGGDGNVITLGEPLVSGPRRKFNMFQMVPQYPPAISRFGSLRSAIGAAVPPGSRGLELLIGLHIDRDTYAVRDSVTIRYTAGGKKYETTVPYRLVFCPSTMTEDECDDRFYSSSLWDDPS